MKEEEIELARREEKPLLESHPGPSGRSRERERNGRDNTVGILRLDAGKPRRSSGSSVEFRTPTKLHAHGCAEPASPQPSVDRLSVTFAAEEPSVISMDKVRFEADHVPSEAEEEEDYSQSVSAIFQRKASTRRSRKRRRSSSPKFPAEVEDGQNVLRNSRRRSSVFTTSSGDTAISVEDAVQEQILQNIKLHKEVLSSVKQQPWNMRRKLRLVRQAKAYIQRHEGELQERLAQSRSTRDILARFNIVIIKHWQHTKRELANFMNVLIPWEIRIKEIESHFGSVVASYFTFLRWLFWVNLVTALLLIIFVAVPEMVISNPEKAGMRKKMLKQEEANATNLFTLWEFDGVLKYSPLFYGYYSYREKDPDAKDFPKKINYSMPLAYFITELVVYIYCFVAILRRMAENSRQSKLSEKDDECVFTWKLFTGWDYMIGNSETAHNRTASIILGFKEALLEEAEKKRDEGRNWKVTSLRVFAHMNVLWLLGSSVYAVILVVQRSTQVEEHHGWWRKNEITIVVSLITTLFPAFFEGLGIIEQYHPRKKLRMQLARIMALNLLNIYTLIFASFSKINEMSDMLEKMRDKVPQTLSQPVTAQQVGVTITDYLEPLSSYSGEQNFTLTPEAYQTCINIIVPCSTLTTTAMVGLISSLTTNSTVAPSTKTTNDEFHLSSLPSSFPTAFSVSTPPFFSRSTTDPETTLDFNDSTKGSSSEFLTSTTETSENVADEVDFLYDFLPVNNIPDSDSYMSFNYSEEDNKTQSNSNEVEISNETDYSNTTSNSSAFQFSNDDFDQESSTVVGDSTSSPESPESTVELVSPYTTTSSHNTDSAPTEKMCVEKRCETITIPVLKPTVPTPPTTMQRQPTFATTTKSTVTTTGFQEENWCKSLPPPTRVDLTPYISSLDLETRKKLVPLCWETMFGREMVKLTVMDLVMTVISTLMVDFFRAVFVRFMNNCWCWDLEKKFPQYGDFKIAENILHLVNNQGMVWMGMFFSPGLPLINVIKLAIMMYLRSWAVLTCNVPHEVVFRASSSNNFYLALLLTMLFLCVLPVGYAVVWVVPSWHCGPFSTYYRIYHIFTKSLKAALPYDWLHKAFDYIASPSIVIPLLMLMVLIIYYLISLTSALREANNDLKIQLRRERTEERRKMFQLVDKKRQEAENPSLKWKKAMPNFPYGKLSISDIPIDLLKSGALNGSAKHESSHKELIEEFMKKAKRMPSGTSEDENALLDVGDGTDAEQHDSLPYDVSKHPKYSELLIKKSQAKKPVAKDEGYKERRNGKKKMHKEKNALNNEGEGSGNSGWSEIPEIRIIQTESAEHLDDPDVHFQTNTKDESKSKKMREKKSKDVSSQQTVKKRTDRKSKHAKHTKSETEDVKEVDNDIVEGSPQNPRKTSRQKKSSKACGDPSVEKCDSENDNYEEGSFSEGSIGKSDIKRGNKPKLFKVKTVIAASNAMKSHKANESVIKSEKSDGKTGTKSKSILKEKSQRSQQKSSKPKFKEMSDEDSQELSQDSERESCEYEVEKSDNDSEADEDQSQDETNNSNEDRNRGNKSGNGEEGSLSGGRRNNSKTETKPSTVQLKKQTNSTESEGSDVSSQNTVKQIESPEHTDEETNIKMHGTKEVKNSKKAIARFKIANVLLKEARRRSSAGLDEK